MFHRDWCKKAVIALKQGKPIEAYRVFVSGPGGVGKSHVIRLIHSDTIKLLRLSGSIEPDDVIVPYSLDSTPTQIALHFGQKVRVGVLSNIIQFLESTPTTFWLYYWLSPSPTTQRIHAKTEL